jgi:hypothetical protein
LCTYYHDESASFVTASDITTTLRSSVRAPGTQLDFLASEVSARSLRAAGGMALLCAHVDTGTIISLDDGTRTSCLDTSRYKHSLSCATFLGGCSKAPTTFSCPTKTCLDNLFFHSLFSLFSTFPSLRSSLALPPTQHVRTPTTYSTEVVEALEVIFQLTFVATRRFCGSCKSRLYHHSLAYYIYIYILCLTITVLARLVSVTLATHVTQAFMRQPQDNYLYPNFTLLAMLLRRIRLGMCFTTTQGRYSIFKHCFFLKIFHQRITTAVPLPPSCYSTRARPAQHPVPLSVP